MGDIFVNVKLYGGRYSTKPTHYSPSSVNSIIPIHLGKDCVLYAYHTTNPHEVKLYKCPEDFSDANKTPIQTLAPDNGQRKYLYKFSGYEYIDTSNRSTYRIWHGKGKER